ncbi:MAG TPA: OFA family MFS transporter [Chloroflexia bacterium]|jgi:OFA family oxalate/formate antiporter-like MFS transporter|nr:OFA family MFS transporter [Chloroflexia bacterium]
MAASNPVATADPGVNRWTVAIAGVIMQLALGAIYAWSLFVKPLNNIHPDWSRTDITVTFSIALVGLGVGAIVGGTYLDKYGPRAVATVAGLFYGIGFIGAGLIQSLWGLWLTYGVLSGIGMGLGYIVPLATLIKWFPDKRGLITGLAVAGFGGGAVVTTLIAPGLISGVGVYNTFIVLGIVYLIMVAGAAQFYRVAPAGYAPPGWTPSATQASQRAGKDFTLQESLRTWQWYVLWAMLFLNVTAGVMVISQAAPMTQEITGVDATTASSIVILISIFNGAGRLFWAWLSDTITRRWVFLAMFLIQFVLFLIMPAINNFFLLSVFFMIVALCYGGGFGTMPAFAADYFGPKFAGRIYGLMLSAWSAGGVLGPILIANVYDNTKKYSSALTIVAVVMLVSAVLPFIARPPRVGPAEATTERTAPAPGQSRV